MKKLLFVYNPRAGQGLLKQVLSEVLDIFVKAGYEVTVHPTQAIRDGYDKVCQMSDDFDRVVCAGGDGTIDEVMTAMMHRKHKVPIGYIPTGTTNDFANSLKIPTEYLAAARNAVEGAIFPCDVGLFNQGVFVYVAAFGIFTAVSYKTNQTMKNALGHIAYILEGAKSSFNVPSYKIRVEHDGEVIEDEFIFGMVTNSKSIGGFRHMVGNNVKFDDGVFEVTLIRKPTNPIAVTEILASLMIEQINTDHMYTFKAKEITFKSEENIPWTLDGEDGKEHNDLIIINSQKAVELIVPADQIKDLSADYSEEE